MRTILIAEDNQELSELMSLYLKKAGHQVIAVYDGVEALRFFDKVDLILLDIMLPKKDGFDICRAVRDRRNIPIIVVSAKISEDDKEKMFTLGADDYMTKPFSLKEMVFRVNAQLRRYYEWSIPPETAEKKYGDLVISAEHLEARIKDRPLPLTAKEFKILDYLSSHENQVMKKQTIIDGVWGVNEYIDENTLAVTVGRLRDKLAREGYSNIVTVWGVGYKWQS